MFVALFATCAVQSLDARLPVARAAFGAPGLVVAVVRPGIAPRFVSSGETAPGAAPVTPDTVFPIGSCTKALTSALAASLADDGRFDLDAPVRNYSPDFRLADPAADALVTTRDLLSHRTGVEGHDLLWYRAPWPQAEAVARLKSLKPVGEFRNSYHYSSLQYLAAGQALSRAAGKPWAESVAERLTGPLGMAATTFVTPGARAGRAAGHRRAPGGGPEAMPEYRLVEPNAAGSVYSSARDLSRFAEFQLGGGEFRGRRVVSARSLAQTHAPHIAMPLGDPGIGPSYPASTRADYCQGWVKFDYRGLTLWSHGGVSDGFRAQITLCPGRGFAVVVLSNLHKTRLNLAATYLAVDEQAGLVPRDWASHFLAVEARERAEFAARLAARDRLRGVPAPPRPLQAYCGAYREEGYGEATVTEVGGRLRLRWAGIDTPLEPYSGDFFRLTAGPVADELAEFGPLREPRGLRLFGRLFAAAD